MWQDFPLIRSKNQMMFLQGDVETFETLQEALIDVDFVFEAIVDRLDVKQWLYESKLRLS